MLKVGYAHSISNPLIAIIKEPVRQFKRALSDLLITVVYGVLGKPCKTIHLDMKQPSNDLVFKLWDQLGKLRPQFMDEAFAVDLVH